MFEEWSFYDETTFDKPKNGMQDIGGLIRKETKACWNLGRE